MDLQKHADYFDPRKHTDPIHIVGCGSIGSTVAELLTRLGFEALHLYDFDKVTAHNLTNQLFRHKDISADKVDALTEQLQNINPNLKVIKHKRGWVKGRPLEGHVFMCVDDITVRQNIVAQEKAQRRVISIHDFRTRLTDAQYYMAASEKPSTMDMLQESMNFTPEEAKAATPVSACGTTLCVTPTVRAIVDFGIGNFIQFLQQKDHARMLVIDPYKAELLRI